MHKSGTDADFSFNVPFPVEFGYLVHPQLSSFTSTLVPEENVCGLMVEIFVVWIPFLSLSQSHQNTTESGVKEIKCQAYLEDTC